MATTTNTKGTLKEGREDFYRRARTRNLTPVWTDLPNLVTPEPRSPCVPTLWRYSEIRPYLIESCQVVSTDEADRRVMTLENPGLVGQQRITRSLFAGFQTILPGEKAAVHRHTASALRFIVEGKDTFTAVGGERTMMEPGDFIITPSMAWHDHGNEGDGPMIWLDCLDMHIVNLVDASFRDELHADRQLVTRPLGASDAESGCNLVPIDQEYTSLTSPIFKYPYSRTRDAIDKIRKFREPDRCHAFKMKYINPTTGDYAVPTIATWMQLLPKGFTTEPYRSTDSTVFVVVEGNGSSTIGDQTFEWGPHDVFVVPSWHFHQHTAASGDAVLFVFSDRALQEKIDIFREQRGNEAFSKSADEAGVVSWRARQSRYGIK